MNVSLILSIVGGIALLIGLFGDGRKEKRIVIPKINIWSKVFSIIFGIVLIGLATWLSVPVSPEKIEPHETITTTSTNLDPVPTSTQENRSPVIKSVVVQERGYDTLEIGVFYYDLDGDAYYIDWELNSIENLGEQTIEGGFETSMGPQKNGAALVGRWNCNGKIYSVNVKATIIDRAGSESNTYEFVLNCQ